MIGQRIPLEIVPTFFPLYCLVYRISFVGKKPHKMTYFIITQIVGLGIFLQEYKSGVQDAFEGHPENLGNVLQALHFSVFT